ncbi:hypothetical protein [Variovorax sp. E3]|nr:hypothetical protein [Variovorax sp. E3]
MDSFFIIIFFRISDAGARTGRLRCPRRIRRCRGFDKAVALGVELFAA